MSSGGRLSHAYIISGAPSEAFARAKVLACAMLCREGGTSPCGQCHECRKSLRGIHPDIIIVERPMGDKGQQKKEISVSQARELVSDASTLPNEAERKVYIIKDAGAMNTQAQNALLKLLEEPPSFVSFILVTENSSLILETVRSRCVCLSINGEIAPPEQKFSALAPADITRSAGDAFALDRERVRWGESVGVR